MPPLVVVSARIGLPAVASLDGLDAGPTELTAVPIRPNLRGSGTATVILQAEGD